MKTFKIVKLEAFWIMRKKSKQVLITLLEARPLASKGEGGSKNIYQWTFYT